MESLIPKLIVAVIVFFFIAYSLKQVFRTDRFSVKRKKGFDYKFESKDIEEELREEAKKREDKFKKVSEYSRKNPQKTATIITNFLHEEDKDKLVKD